MQPELGRQIEVKAWLTRVSRDLRAADNAMTAVPSLYDAVVFHSQQAAEKALKAFLTWHDAEFRRTHDLAQIGLQCVQIDPTLEDTCRRADNLSVFAWLYRYPGDEEEPPLEVAEEALVMAREVFEAVLARIPPEAHP